MKNKIILSLLLSAFVLFLTSCLSLFTRSVGSFEKEFIAMLEKYIASEDYSGYYKAYKETLPSMKRKRMALGSFGNYEPSSEDKNRNQAIENILKMEKYKNYYDFSCAAVFTNQYHIEIKNGYKKLDEYMSADNYMAYIEEFEYFLFRIKNYYGESSMIIDEKYQSYYRDCINHFLKKIAINYFSFELNKEKQEYIIKDFYSNDRNARTRKSSILKEKTIVVPAMHNNLPVTEIAKIDQYGHSNLVILPDTIKKIAAYALPDKQIAVLPKDVNIADVLLGKEKLLFRLPKSLDSIGSYAFSSSKFDEIHLNFEFIGENAFVGCKFKNIIISKLVPRILVNCEMENVVIKDSVQNIVKHAFKGCSISGNFIIPNSITTIGEKAFYDSTILNGIIIPDSVKIIGHAAFFKSKIPSIAFSGENIKFEGSYTFAGNESLKSITLPKNIKYIPEGFFRDCSELSEIKNLPDSGEIQFGADAFTGCKSLPQAIRDKLISLGYKDGFFKLDSKYMP